MRIRARKDITHDSVDYALKEQYFITICVDRKNCLLGKLIEYTAILSELGEKVVLTINYINEIYNTEVITCYVIMPNHIHMIIDMSRRYSEQSNTEQPDSVADIIRNFKPFTTHEFNKNQTEVLLPLWQRGYHDHRIRNDDELKMIQEYINENPKRWAIDKFYIM